METPFIESDPIRKVLWLNFGASLDMVSQAVKQFPEAEWLSRGKFYYMAYHTAIFADYYLSHPVRAFAPRIPYHLASPDNIPAHAIDDVLPKHLISQQEMADYLKHIRKKAHKLILEAPIGAFIQRWIAPEEIEMHGLCPGLVEGYSLLEILLYNLRHIQHHCGQLNLLLREQTGQSVDWISMAE